MFTIEFVLKFDDYKHPVRVWNINDVHDLKMQLEYMRTNRGFAGRGTYRRWRVIRNSDNVVLAQWHSK